MKIYAVAGIVSGAVLGIAASTAGLSSGDSKLPDILGLSGGLEVIHLVLKHWR
ncbi:hypothetical protein IWX76_000103 [Pedobacter sp. CAN_A7]|uniref:hypothetical protein n=1 Tax=Pedobacter sp. CAN_A7 TaxID=2787722 RepID=UPI0018C972E7